MGIYLILTLLGNIVVTVGPTPRTMDNCLEFAAEQLVDIYKNVDKYGPIKYKGQEVDKADIKMTCIQSYSEPVIGTKYLY